MVRTKIVATLGPASHQEAVLRKMFTAGLDLVRLNFSHGEVGEHLAKIKLIRRLNKKMRRRIKIMQDLEGYRLRLGRLSEPLLILAGRKFCLTQEDVVGAGRQLPFDYRGSLKPIKNGALIYVDDGKVVFKVTGRQRCRLEVKALVGGLLHERKGINIPGVKLEFSALTAKDREDVKVAVEQKVDYLAQSFVRDAQDIATLKAIVSAGHPACRFLAKVENQEALQNIDEIIKASDGIIIARGDLGICLPIYKVPVIQKEIIKKCRLQAKPVVVATQMLESMTESSLPTRAEVSDVANAILDGASHLLLSGETAVGCHPQRVVSMMNKIIKNTESYQDRLKGLLQ